MQHLRTIRVITSVIIFAVAFISFVGLPALLLPLFIQGSVLKMQLVPSILNFSVVGIASFAFIVIILLTLLFGRFYCSSICPMGTLQDIINRLSKPFRKRKIFRFTLPYKKTKYIILALTIVPLFLSSSIALALLDPYSNFGKIISAFFRPITYSLNNLLSNILGYFDIYSVDPVIMGSISITAIIYASVLLISLVLLVFFHGRLYCNSICPVGTTLGLLSKFSFFKLKIENTKCTQCGKCSSNCKAECIDIKNKELDFERCIGCYNCINVCAEKAISYSKLSLVKVEKENPTDEAKRSAFKTIAATGLGLVFANKYAFSQHETGKKNTIEVKKKHTVSPPGSDSHKHFLAHCTACHLCVSQCPSNVLKPSFLQYGLEGMMMPYLDFEKSFCNFECTQCSQVCPTGAIKPIDSKKKVTVQMGIVQFIKENCIVYLDETACGACSEHCPTKAVHMVPYKGMITIPETIKDICIGCGACEFACPAKPNKAIYIEGNTLHLTAKKPKEEKQEESNMEEFPF